MVSPRSLYLLSVSDKDSGVGSNPTWGIMETRYFEDDCYALFHTLICPMYGTWVTGTTNRWCCEKPSGWQTLCCWNWGGTFQMSVNGIEKI